MKDYCVACYAPLEKSEERYDFQGNYCDRCCARAGNNASTKRYQSQLDESITLVVDETVDNDDQTRASMSTTHAN